MQKEKESEKERKRELKPIFFRNVVFIMVMSPTEKLNRLCRKNQQIFQILHADSSTMLISNFEGEGGGIVNSLLSYSMQETGSANDQQKKIF